MDCMLFDELTVYKVSFDEDDGNLHQKQYFSEIGEGGSRKITLSEMGNSIVVVAPSYNEVINLFPRAVKIEVLHRRAPVLMPVNKKQEKPVLGEPCVESD